MSTTLKFSNLSAGSIPGVLQGFIDQGQWSKFHIEVTNAHKDITTKACLLECGVCWFFGCICVFCAHPCIQDAMGKSKLNGCCNRANKTIFQGREVFSMRGDILYVNQSLLNGLPKKNSQVNQSQMHHRNLGQPQYVQSQQHNYSQSQSRYVQAQPHYVLQGQTQHYSQGPSVSQPPQYAETQPPPYSESAQMYSQPPMATAVAIDSFSQSEAPSTKEGQYTVSDPSVLGTSVTVKTPDGQAVSINIPKDCAVGSVISYRY